MISAFVSIILRSSLIPPVGSLALFQLQPLSGDGNSRLMLVFVGIAAISLLILTLIVVGVLVGIIFIGLRARKTLTMSVQEIKGKMYPIIDKTSGILSDVRPSITNIVSKTDTLVGDLAPTIKGIAEQTHTLIADLSPKVSGITDDVRAITVHAREMATSMKEKLEEFSPSISAVNETLKQTNATVREANDRTRQQVERVNGIVTDVLDWSSRIPAMVQRGISVPGQKVGQAVDRVKAAGDSLNAQTTKLWNKYFPRSGNRSPQSSG
jgi:methyl-accepting chemotaxis protein